SPMVTEKIIKPSSILSMNVFWGVFFSDIYMVHSLIVQLGMPALLKYSDSPLNGLFKYLSIIIPAANILPNFPMLLANISIVVLTLSSVNNLVIDSALLIFYPHFDCYVLFIFYYSYDFFKLLTAI
ncbi:hypothetical protein, partial [Serratia marcescens]|uniref:hypothetical protein n=1 Tax=Serratia marcescens TaxID=615 RepID=UPI001C37B2B8